jgi:hypothetical protein
MISVPAPRLAECFARADLLKNRVLFDLDLLSHSQDVEGAGGGNGDHAVAIGTDDIARLDPDGPETDGNACRLKDDPVLPGAHVTAARPDRIADCEALGHNAVHAFNNRSGYASGLGNLRQDVAKTVQSVRPRLPTTTTSLGLTSSM